MVVVVVVLIIHFLYKALVECVSICTSTNLDTGKRHKIIKLAIDVQF